MKRRDFSITLFCSVLILILILDYAFLMKDPPKTTLPEVFVGVDVAYSDIEEIKTLIDKVSSYTNLFVIGSTGISHDQMKLEETCKYLGDKDMQFIIYTEYPRRLELINQVAKNMKTIL